MPDRARRRPAELAAELMAAGRAVDAAELLGTATGRAGRPVRRPRRQPGGPERLIAVAPSVDGASAATRSVRAAGPPGWLAGPPGAPDGWALPEDAFEHRDSMITKAEVRALALARLGPGPGRSCLGRGRGQRLGRGRVRPLRRLR